MPDAKTIWLFREQLTRAGAIKELFASFDAHLKARGHLAMSGQIVDASIIAAPRQRNTEAEKTAIKEGRIPEDWASQPEQAGAKGSRREVKKETTKEGKKVGVWVHDWPSFLSLRAEQERVPRSRTIAPAETDGPIICYDRGRLSASYSVK